MTYKAQHIAKNAVRLELEIVSSLKLSGFKRDRQIKRKISELRKQIKHSNQIARKNNA